MLKNLAASFIVLICASCSTLMPQTTPSEDIVYEVVTDKMQTMAVKLISQFMGVPEMVAGMIYNGQEIQPTEQTALSCKKILKKALGDTVINNTKGAEAWIATPAGAKAEKTVQGKIIMDVFTQKANGIATAK